MKEQVFEIDFPNRSRVSELQDKISKISNDRLTRAMQDSFEKIIPPDALIKLDSLALDLGEINYDSLDTDLEPRLIDALEHKLSQVLRLLLRDGVADETEGAVLTPISSNEEILEYFLLNGVLPWWVQQDNNFSLQQLVDELFKREPAVLRSLLVRTGRHEFVRRRIVQQFGYESIRQVITVLEPAEAGYILDYHTEVVAIQRKEQVVQSETAAFEKAVWLFILNYLLNERGGDFNRKSFVRSSLVQMAAYFSVEYYELLVVFYRAVSIQSTQVVHASSLEQFIRELTADEELLQTEQFTAVRYAVDPSRRNEPETLAGKAELLVYYFRYGSLPEGNNGYSVSTLADLFSELVRDVPESLQHMLFTLRGEAGFARRWWELFGADRSKELLNALYPETGRLLNSLSSLLEWVQTHQQVFNTDKTDLKKTLTNLSLTNIVFFDRTSMREIDLLRAILTQLADHYQMDNHAFIRVINESLRESFRQGINNSRVPELIREIAEGERRAGEKDIISALIDRETIKLLTTESVSKGLLDTLIYLVQYGNIPWWGRSFFINATSDERFSELMANAPHSLQELIRLAGSEPRWQARFISFVSVETMYRVLETLPGGKEGVIAVKQLMGWIDRPARAQQTTADLPARILLQALWDDIAHHAYRSFSITGLYSLAVVRLSAQLSMPPLEIVQLLQKAAMKKVGGTVEERNILADLLEILRDYDAAGNVSKFKEVFRKGRSAAVSPEIQKDQELEVMLMLSNSLPQDSLVTPEKLTGEALRLIEYFFTWNRLPGDWDETLYLPLNIMLKQMLLLSFRENKTALETLLKNVSHIPAARIFFHELVAESKGGVEKQVAVFIAPFRETYQRLAIERSLADATRLRVDTASATASDRPVVLPAAGLADWLQWIESFLLTGVMPQQTDTEEKIRAVMIQLYLADKTALKKLLDNKDQQPIARVRLHDMLIGQPGYLEREVLRILEPYREADMLALLESKEMDIDPAAREKILLRLLTPGKKIKELADLRELVMNSPSFIRYLTTDTNPEGLAIFTERTGIGWGADTVQLLQGLRALFIEAIPGNLERDKILSLLLQFNLLFLSGKLYIRTARAYLQAFFAFVHQSVAYALPPLVWRAILVHIERKKDFAPAISAEQLITVEKEIYSLIRNADNLPAKEILPTIADDNEEETAQKQQRLEEIRAELEKERLREEERREKEFRKLQEDKNNKIYIRNAGLVLLHPFLGTYFTRLGLMEQGKFNDEAAQHRAVLLLQYLLNGRNESEEFELPLNKILCGLPLEEAIPLQIELTEEEVTVSSELFQVIFQRWEKMKNTSVEGFRASFLQREGALSRLEENWELRVEQRAYDMLLQTLPWAYGMIKNTWMTKMLLVEWN